MINLKKSILGLVALVMVFGLVFTVSAFKINQETSSRDTLVFQYTGTSFTEADYEIASYWTPTEDMSDCDGSGNICKLSIDENELWCRYTSTTTC